MQTGQQIFYTYNLQPVSQISAMITKMQIKISQAYESLSGRITKKCNEISYIFYILILTGKMYTKKCKKMQMTKKYQYFLMKDLKMDNKYKFFLILRYLKLQSIVSFFSFKQFEISLLGSLNLNNENENLQQQTVYRIEKFN